MRLRIITVLMFALYLCGMGEGTDSFGIGGEFHFDKLVLIDYPTE
jgi:hypothetical protein